MPTSFSLTLDSTHGSLVLVTGEDAIVEASSDGAAGGRVGEATREWLRVSSKCIMHADLPAHVRGDLRLPEAHSTVIAPLTVRGDLAAHPDKRCNVCNRHGFSRGV